VPDAAPTVCVCVCVCVIYNERFVLNCFCIATACVGSDWGFTLCIILLSGYLVVFLTKE
jgi:hypothetical protein